jgi:hypothetical protein
MNSDRAKTLLQDEFFTELVEKQKALYINNILNSEDDAVDVRERTLLKLRGLEEFIASLESVAVEDQIDKKRWKIL